MEREKEEKVRGATEMKNFLLARLYPLVLEGSYYSETSACIPPDKMVSYGRLLL